MTHDSPRDTPLLGCIADDFTGATDLANMLVREGMRTLQTIGIPAAPVRGADAVVVALKSRTLAASDAVAQSLAALQWLREQGCRQFFFKYCSTFDSTDAGNIGPVAEALQKALGADLAIACPAFPENGRTVYRGHLFVHDTLLNESGMQNHPLTPMRDANLVRVLQRQSSGKVGLIGSVDVGRGPVAVRARMAALRKEGVTLAIADAIADKDLYTLGEACAGMPLVTGGSGLALGLPGNFRNAGMLIEDGAATRALDGLDLLPPRGVVLAGSASQATQGQVAHWLARRPALRIDPLALARGEDAVQQAIDFAQAHADQAVLIYATAVPDQVQAAQAQLGVERAGHLVEQAMSSVAQRLYAHGVARLVVAGGETSGAVVQALDVRALRIGPQIDPGVPATLAVDADGGPLCALALKSGNFGTVDFFEKALRALGAAH
ncbi:3-oxo-tetronate kinase [Bordetella sp. FB-8]|uniref:3-oxo-tetronate kinase n=1 Tax=Bordetella sp. FB-8 TaxID=1159870 RepID=UPI00036B1D66|nr:3-oxo-tetronate kinase [Bordetella sp. FB-8]